MRICFLITHIPDPRINKRIETVKTLGEVHVICIRRASQNIWEPQHSDVVHHIIEKDLPSSRQYVKRLRASKTLNKQIAAQLRQLAPDVIYAGSLDMLLLAKKYKQYCNKQCKIIFEVADLRECFIQKPDGFMENITMRCISHLEKQCFPAVDYLVITSMPFFDRHYCRLITRDRVIYAPNIPDTKVFASYQHKAGGTFTVGFIGGIRYLKQMKLVVDACGKAGCNLLFAGAGGTDAEYKEITEYCKSKPYVEFTGKYDYNTQIADLYGRVDCVYAVYDATNPNVRIALPNKLYESVLCELPILVAKNTYLSELVEQHQIGISCACNSIEDTVAAIQTMQNAEKYAQYRSNCCKAQNVLLSTDWREKLRKVISTGNEHAE